MSTKKELEIAVSPEHLAKVLNQHGFSFQYAVARAIVELPSDDRRAWNVEGIEVPVEVKGVPTHIDILLRHRFEPMYLVVECKRANPRLSNWCFLKAPYSTSYRVASQILVEVLNVSDGANLVAGMHSFGSGTDVYHIPLELKNHDRGDVVGSMGRGAVEEAATQVLRHLNGFVELLDRTREFVKDLRRAFILPAIVTTARLFTCNADLSRADLSSGNIDLREREVKEVPWLYYQYNQSPGLKHGVRSQHAIGRLEEFIASEYSRSIAVVSPGGLEDFLRRSAALL